ncbi:MAG: LysR family transcriptional regulator [Burkholderiales bacterium]
MHPRIDHLDWNHLKAFLETAEAGTLSAAARRLGVSQPTLGRQVAAIERRLGVTLFERIGRSMSLTGTGVALLEHARAMGAAAEDLHRSATGRAQAVDGPVSVSATEVVGAFLLPPVLERLRREAPGIVVEVVLTDAISDLRRREADIAIRHLRPDQPDLIGRRIRDAPAGFYAAEAWVRRHGRPRTAADAAGLEFVGSDRSPAYADTLRALGLPIDAARFSCHAGSTLMHWLLVRQGLGIGVTMDEIARITPGVVRVLDAVPGPSVPIWLVTHRELRTSRRIRVVFDVLAEALAGDGAPAEAAGPVR